MDHGPSQHGHVPVKFQLLNPAQLARWCLRIWLLGAAFFPPFAF